MKRKIIILLTLLLCVICTIGLSACQGGCNYQIIDLQYAYTHAYIKIGNEWISVPIAKWTDYEGEQIQITLKDGSVVLTSSINCILYYGKLPNL